MQQDTDTAELDAVWSLLYPDLQRIARSRLRRSGHNTLLETSGLISEAYLRVSKAASVRDASPGQFLAYAGRTMRSVVVDLLRERQAVRRGGEFERVQLNTAIIEGLPAEDEPLRIDEALKTLARVEPRLCQVIEMRYFAGFTEIEIADALGVTERTVRRDWTKACLLLRALLERADE